MALYGYLATNQKISSTGNSAEAGIIKGDTWLLKKDYTLPQLGLDDSITDMEEMEVPEMEIEIVDPESVTLSDGSMEITYNSR